MKQENNIWIIILTFALFVFGGCSDDDEQMVEKCGATDIIRMGEYVLVNDDSPHPGYAQCIFEDQREGTFGWTWEADTSASEQSDSGTSAYIFYGKADPGEGLAPSLWDIGSTTPALPIQVENLTSLTIDYDVHVSTTGRYRVGFSTDNYGCLVGSCTGPSLSIDIYSDSPPSSVYFQQRITIDGEEYDFYKDTSNLQFSYYWFVKVIPSHSGTLHVHTFLDFLANEGYDENSIELFQIEYLKFFQRIWDADSGNTIIHTYSIDVQSRVQ